MTRLPLAGERSRGDERDAIARARSGPAAVALLTAALACLDRALAALPRRGPPPDSVWDELAGAYAAIDRYLEHMVEESGVRPRCGAGCSACCTDLAPTLAVEGLRIVRHLHTRADGGRRMQVAVVAARAFQKLLAEAAADGAVMGTKSAIYRAAQRRWRGLGRACPALADDGRCSIYEHRPLACRVYVSVEDPARCAPDHPEFNTLSRPALWSSGAESAFERKLQELGARLGLPPTPNLAWSLALLHGHPLARPGAPAPG